jgi:hypothetical protein
VDEVMRIFDGEVIDKPTVADLIGIEEAKTESTTEETPPDSDPLGPTEGFTTA